MIIKRGTECYKHREKGYKQGYITTYKHRLRHPRHTPNILSHNS